MVTLSVWLLNKDKEVTFPAFPYVPYLSSSNFDYKSILIQHHQNLMNCNKGSHLVCSNQQHELQNGVMNWIAFESRKAQEEVNERNTKLSC